MPPILIQILIYEYTDVMLPTDIWRLILALCEQSAARYVCRLWSLLVPRVKLDIRSFACNMLSAEWVVQNNCPVEYVSRWAANVGVLEVLEWSCNKLPPNVSILQAAVDGNRHSIVAWLTKRGCDSNDVKVFRSIAKHGDISMIKLFDSDGTISDIADESVCETASKHRKYDVLRYLIERGCQWDYRTACNVIRHDTSQEAIPAPDDSLDILKWLHARTSGDARRVCNIVCCSVAAAYGSMRIIKWLRLHDCPWDDGVLNMAAREGHLDIIKWAVGSGCPLSEYGISMAAMEGGHIPVLAWLMETYYCNLTTAHLACAVRKDHLHVMKWLYDTEGLEQNRYVGIDAHWTLDALKWVHEHGYVWNPRKLGSYAEFSGNAAVVNWLCENGFAENVLDNDGEIIFFWKNESQNINGRRATHADFEIKNESRKHTSQMNVPNDIWAHILSYCENTAARMVCKRWRRLAPKVQLRSDGFVRNINVSIWAIGAGCSPNRLCMSAAAIGNLSVLEWICNRCECDTRTASAIAAGSGHLNVVKWIAENEWSRNLHCNCIVAAAGDHVEVLKYSYYEGAPIEIADLAAYNGCFKVLKWLRAVEPPPSWSRNRTKVPVHHILDKDTCYAAAIGGHLDILRWLGTVGFRVHKPLTVYIAVHNRVDMLQWMHGAGQVPKDIYNVAEAYEGTTVLEWAKKHGYKKVPGNPLEVRQPGRTLRYWINSKYPNGVPFRAENEEGKIVFRYKWAQIP